MTRPLSSAQLRAIDAHEEYREKQYRSIAIRLDVITDSRGARKKRPRFPGGSWQAAEALDVRQAARDGFTDVAIVCDPPVATLDFDPRPGESDREVLARCETAIRTWKLDGAVLERSGHGYHGIIRAPVGEWSRRIWGAPHPIDEVRCGRDDAGRGLLLFVAPSFHPVELRYYKRLTPLVAVDALPECPRELLEQPPPIAKLATTAVSTPRRSAALSEDAHSAGDWRTLDVVKLFRDAGLYRGELRAKAGYSARHSVHCPWESAHTSGSDGTDTMVVESDGTHGPLFRCLHSHCSSRTMADVREFFGGDAVDRCCSRTFEPTPRVRSAWKQPAGWWDSLLGERAPITA